MGAFRTLLCLLVSLVGLCLSQSSSTFYIGVVINQGPSQVTQWNYTALYLTANSLAYFNASLEFIIYPTTWGELPTLIQNFQIHFVITSPGDYSYLEVQYGIYRLVTLRRNLKTVLYSKFAGTIFSLASAPIVPLSEIAGMDISAVDPFSTGGFQAQQCLLSAPQSAFKNISFSEDHQLTITNIFNGAAKIGFARSDAFPTWQTAHPTVNVSAVFYIYNAQPPSPLFPFIHSTTIFPEWPFAAVPGVELLMDLSKLMLMLLDIKPTSSAAIGGGYYGWNYPQSYTALYDCLQAIGEFDTAKDLCFANCDNGKCSVINSTDAVCVCEQGYNGTYCDTLGPYVLVNVEWSSGTAIAIAVVTALLLLATFVYGVLIYIYRDTAVMKASSPRFCYTILAGSTSCLISIYFWLGEPNLAGCVLRSLFLTIGIVMILGSLFVKSYRVWRVFKTAETLAPMTPLPDPVLFGYLGVILLPVLILQIVWFAHGQSYTALVRHSDAIWEAEVKCVIDDSTLFTALIVGYFGLFIIYGCYIMYGMRKISDRYNESKYMTFILYNLGMCGLAAYLIISLVSLSVQAKTIVVCVFIMLVSFINQSILFIPKLLQIRKTSSNSSPTSRGSRSSTFKVTTIDN